MTKNLHQSIKFEDRYYICYISSEYYIDLWRFFVIKHSLKDQKTNTYIFQGEYYTMDRTLRGIPQLGKYQIEP